VRLNRVLTARAFNVIPFWQFTEDRIAHVAAMNTLNHVPLYGRWAELYAGSLVVGSNAVGRALRPRGVGAAQTALRGELIYWAK